MNILGYSLPIGRVFGITIRVHVLLFLLLYYELSLQKGELLFALAVLLGTYFCILLHEFGHSLAARFGGGDSDEIILWPLGGLAWCRSVHHPMAHLITTAAGPLVTLIIWLVLAATAALVPETWLDGYARWFVLALAFQNKRLLLFNLIPAFPMDGGRILHSLLWYRLGLGRAAHVVVIVSRCIAVVGIIVGFGRLWGADFFIGFIALMILFEAPLQAMALASGEEEGFSLRHCIETFSARRIFSGQTYGAEPMWWERWISDWKHRRMMRHTQLRVVREQEAEKSLDDILDKISRQGMQSLTAAERKTLDRTRSALIEKDRKKG